MPAYKVTFFFEGFQPSRGEGSGSAVGWTETWYASITGGIDAMLFDPAVTTYITLRRAFLPSLYRVAWIRASQEANPRNTKVRSIDQAFGQAEGDAAQVTCAVLADFTALPIQEADHAHHRRFLIRGLSSAMMDGNVIFPASPDWRTLKQFLDYLGTGAIGGQPNPIPNPTRWQIRFVPADTPFSAITGLKIDAESNHYVGIAAPNVVPDEGRRWIVKGVRHPYYLNRVWTSRGPFVGLPGSAMLGRSRRVLSGDWDFSGIIGPLLYGYEAPSQYLIIGLRDRDTGRPSRLTRGRRNPTV